MRKTLLTIVLCFISFLGFSQIDQRKSIEIEVQNIIQDISYVPKQSLRVTYVLHKKEYTLFYDPTQSSDVVSFFIYATSDLKFCVGVFHKNSQPVSLAYLLVDEDSKKKKANGEILPNSDTFKILSVKEINLWEN